MQVTDRCTEAMMSGLCQLRDSFTMRSSTAVETPFDQLHWERYVMGPDLSRPMKRHMTRHWFGNEEREHALEYSLQLRWLSSGSIVRMCCTAVVTSSSREFFFGAGSDFLASVNNVGRYAPPIGVETPFLDRVTTKHTGDQAVSVLGLIREWESGRVGEYSSPSTGNSRSRSVAALAFCSGHPASPIR